MRNKEEGIHIKKRLDHIDRAKGILIILMVIGHVWQRGFLFDLIYAFHMPAFFVISGILMAHTQSHQKPYLKFVKSRIAAYAVPFLFIELLGCLTDMIRNGGPTLNWKGYLYNTLTFHFNDPNLWFLVDLCLIELLVAAILKVRNSKTMLCAVAAVLFFVRYVLPTEVIYVATISSAFKYLAFFAAGFCGSALLQKKNGFVLCLSVASVLMYAIFGTNYMQGAAKDLGYMVSGFAGAYVTLQIAQLKYPDELHKILSYAGKNTIIIYGTHHFYYAALGVLMGVRDFASTPLTTGLVILAAVMLLEIPTIYIINRWLPFLAGKRRGRSQTA